MAKKQATLLTKTKKYNKVMASTLATIQPNDIYKAITLQFGSSINSTKDVNIIDNNLRESGENAIAKNTNAAGTVVSQTVAKTRENYFFDDEIKEEIESFTYTNDSPKAPICVSLNGKTFRSDDASSYQYTPPLHHNCNSYLVPNFRDAKNNPEATGLKPSESAQKDISLKEL